MKHTERCLFDYGIVVRHPWDILLAQCCCLIASSWEDPSQAGFSSFCFLYVSYILCVGV